MYTHFVCLFLPNIIKKHGFVTLLGKFVYYFASDDKCLCTNVGMFPRLVVYYV